MLVGPVNGRGTCIGCHLDRIPHQDRVSKAIDPALLARPSRFDLLLAQAIEIGVPVENLGAIPVWHVVRVKLFKCRLGSWLSIELALTRRA